jgi:hypothetical protein
MYRALKMINGGEEAEFRHFTTLEAAYIWLTPTNEEQHDEGWHIKLLPAVRRELEDWNSRMSVFGWNELENREETRYIQFVDAWDSPLPRF